MKKALIIVDHAGYLREDFYPACGIDMDLMKHQLTSTGYEVRVMSYPQVYREDIVNLKDHLIIYSSSQNTEYKSYVDDIMFELSLRNTLVPRYEIFKAHDNKGYQEVLKRSRGIHSLPAWVLATAKELDKQMREDDFPVVIKRVDGCMSKNVFRANTKREALVIMKSIHRPKQPIRYFLAKWLDQYVFKKKFVHYDRESDYIGRVVLQKYVPQLTHDWKVIVLWDKYYFFRRGVRDQDFRASGSGQFAFDLEPPEGLLDYSKSIFEKLDTPFLSLDVCSDGNRYDLIEFQGTHFGPLGVHRSNVYYVFEDGEWRRKEKRETFATQYVASIMHYVRHLTMRSE